MRDNYADQGEAEHVQKFLAGEPDDGAWMEDWMGLVLRRTLEGMRIERVRVITEPWSDYTRFGLNLSRLNTAAGEDIRYLSRERADELGLPTYDYWLLDSSTMGILRFDDQDVLLGADVVQDPAVVVEHARYRDLARRFAVPRAAYLNQFDDEFLRKNQINK
ncbi:hypothetical protein HDA44_003683 [Kribbella solani]|uniref:DUF6879 domain-containing protein n=1 Tax=Kribbella solani TaxID=236067 RepID=A0A841DP46_9ACTN|nr:hypothetical protein [Kribbella solani]